MALFINHHDHPGVFKKNSHIHEPNQSYYHQDKFSDMISEQKALHQTLSDAFHDLKTHFQQNQQENSQKWVSVANQLQMICDSRNEREAFERELTTKLAQHDDKLRHILEHDDTLRQDLVERVALVSDENQDILKRLAAYDASNQDVMLQVHKLTDINERMEQETAEREHVQEEVLDRLENQEALMEKVHRQLSEYRAILYERSSYLAGKIEDSYQLTSSYVYQLVSGTDQPLAWYVDQRKTGSDGEKDS